MSLSEPSQKLSPSGAKPAWRSRLVTIASGGAAVAYALFVFVPGQQSIAGIQKTIQDQELQIARSLPLVQPIRDLQDKQAATERFVDSWRSKAPAPEQVASIFAQVITLARANDVEVTSLSPQAEQPLETIGLIPVSLQAKGSYRSLHQLLAGLEAMSGLVWIDEAHLQPQDKTAPESLNCTLKLIIFINRGEISG
jgi:Tfp pilus assembly protein PilO